MEIGERVKIKINNLTIHGIVKSITNETVKLQLTTPRGKLSRIVKEIPIIFFEQEHEQNKELININV